MKYPLVKLNFNVTPTWWNGFNDVHCKTSSSLSDGVLEGLSLHDLVLGDEIIPWRYPLSRLDLRLTTSRPQSRNSVLDMFDHLFGSERLFLRSSMTSYI